MVLQIILADVLLVARIFPRPCGARKNTTQLVKYPRVLSVKPSNKVYLFTHVAPQTFKELVNKCTYIPDRIGILKCWLLRRGENRSTRRKTSRSKERTNNKLNPNATPDRGIELGPNWWQASALTTAPPLRHPSTSFPGLFPFELIGSAGKDPGIGWSRAHLTPPNPGCN